jgi:hypothetical protein
MTAQFFRHSGRLRGGFAVLAALALCLKALVPTGYMIAAVDGHARLIMCPAGLHQSGTMHYDLGGMVMAGVDVMHMDVTHTAQSQQMPSAEHAAHAAQHAAADCPFALAAAAAFATGAPESAEPYFVFLSAAAPVLVASIPTAPPFRHHAPRGPPSLA